MQNLDDKFRCSTCGLYKGTLHPCEDPTGIPNPAYSHTFVEVTEKLTSEVCDPKHDQEFLKATAEADEILCDWCGEPLRLTPDTAWARVHMMKGENEIRTILRGHHSCVDFSVPKAFFIKLYSQ